ncbi:MAG TPA: hypothetical protein VG078_01350 [Acidimicrobiales bacterium]|nr:hypothetical protein [Acidimicrobiales bacterium]
MSPRRWLVAVVAIVALVSCGSDDDEEPARALDSPSLPGFTVVSDANAGFAVSVPESWRQLPLDVGSFDAAADKVRQESDRVGPALTQLKSVVRNGANAAVVDPATGSTVNLIVLPADSEPDEIATQAAIQLRGTGATELQKEEVTVDGVSAVRQRFLLPFPSEAGGVVQLRESQYYVVRRGKAYILTLVGESPDLDRIATSFQLA